MHFIFFYENLTKISQHESGFGIFKQNQDNPDEIEMVGQSKIALTWRKFQARQKVKTNHEAYLDLINFKHEVKSQTKPEINLTEKLS